MRVFKQDPTALRTSAQAAWLLAFAGVIASLSGTPQVSVWGLFTIAVAVATAVILDEATGATKPYLVVEPDGLRLARMNATIPWSDIDRAALITDPHTHIRNHLAIDLSEAGLAEALARAPQLKAIVRRSVLRRRRLEIELPALDASYDELQASLHEAHHR